MKRDGVQTYPETRSGYALTYVAEIRNVFFILHSKLDCLP